MDVDEVLEILLSSHLNAHCLSDSASNSICSNKSITFNLGTFTVYNCLNMNFLFNLPVVGVLRVKSNIMFV